MANFDDALDRILKHEGGYQLTDDPTDSGGQTYAGISRANNRDWPGWDLIDAGVRNSTELQALVADRYRARYWNLIGGDDIPSHEVACSIFSCAVLSGHVNAIRLAQMVLGLKSDGIRGPKTMAALRSLGPDGEITAVLFDSRYAIARILRYSEIVRRRPRDAIFLRGWINRAAEDAA